MIERIFLKFPPWHSDCSFVTPRTLLKTGGTMFFIFRRPHALLFVGFLFLSASSCSPSIKDAPEPQAVRSVPQFKILQDPIVLAPSLDGHVTAVRFFEGERSKLAFSKKRVYASKFAQDSTRTIYTEIRLEHPRPGKRIYFPVTLYFRQNRKTVRIEEIEGQLRPGWTSSDQIIGAGDFVPGDWRRGNYEVDVYIIAEKVATGYFEIY
jgi:hypothetical protein